MAKLEMDQGYKDEIQQLIASAKHPRVIALLQKALSDASMPQENGVDTKAEPTPSVEGCGSSEMRPMSKHKDKSVSMAKISKYGWDQSDKFVKIYITDIDGIDQLKPENIQSDFNQNFIKVELFGVNGKNYGLIINNLYAAIFPKDCSVKVKRDMVIVSLRKTSSKSWECLTAREKKLKDSKERKPPKLDADDKTDPGQGLMKMMQQMYDDGDDEMKRTIRKSWYESQQKKMGESPSDM